MTIKLTFLGAARTVTGSQHLLEVNGYKILLECGLFQGRRQETYQRNRQFYFNPATLDAVLLSHAHIDHSGNLPHLIKNGYHGAIYATPATAHLAHIMLLDSGHIQEADVEFLNKKRRKRGEPPLEPLYTLEEAAQVAQYFKVVPYGQAFEVVDGVQARLVEAGHILGSAAVVLDIEEMERHQRRKMRLWFSGDIGRRHLPLLRDPQLPEDADVLIMECTYGDKPHRDPETAFEEMRQVILRTVQRGGKVIVPAFAVGRTQEIVYGLHRMIVNQEIPRIPVFVDSPLAVDISEAFRAHADCFDEETRAFIAQGHHREALGFDLLTYTRSVEESKALNDMQGPMVIISASGMAETGRILHHLKNNIEDPRHTILIVSWQAPHTLGRRLAEQAEEVRIFGETYRRRAEVATIGGLSAHAGQDFLVEYALATRRNCQQVFLIHGEERGAEPLMEKLREGGYKRVFYPEEHTSVML